VTRAAEPPGRGDLVEVRWVDILEDGSGNPETARLARRTSFGLFWDRRQDAGIDVVVTTTTLDADGPQQAGYCIYPAACVVSMKVVRRARKPRRREKL
jgi:hypothetical protein